MLKLTLQGTCMQSLNDFKGRKIDIACTKYDHPPFNSGCSSFQDWREQVGASGGACHACAACVVCAGLCAQVQGSKTHNKHDK